MPQTIISLEIGGREWRIAAATEMDALVERVQTAEDLAAFPYGLLLWPAAIALVEHLVELPLSQGQRVLELGCGPGLPGLIARWRGGEVMQTDYQDAPLTLARENARRNGVTGIQTLRGDWRDFPAVAPFEWVVGSDILYEYTLHPFLRSLLSAVTVPGGTVLLADPLRPHAAHFVDVLEQDGWTVAMTVKTIAWQEEPREIALFTARRIANELS